MLPIIPLLCLQLNTFSFLPPSDYLHEDLHLNGCGEYINNTYINHVKAAQYLLLTDKNGKKIQCMFCKESPQVTAFETQRHFIRSYLIVIMHAEVYEYKWPIPKRDAVKSNNTYVFTAGSKHICNHLS